MKDSPLGTIRCIPPDTGIPIPTDEERKAVLEAYRRFSIAVDPNEADCPFEARRAAMDRKNFSEILAQDEPLLDDEDFDDPRVRIIAESEFGYLKQASFIIAVTGLPVETYVGALYEISAIEFNNAHLSIVEYQHRIGLEYLAAMLLLEIAREAKSDQMLVH